MQVKAWFLAVERNILGPPGVEQNEGQCIVSLVLVVVLPTTLNLLVQYILCTRTHKAARTNIDIFHTLSKSSSLGHRRFEGIQV